MCGTSPKLACLLQYRDTFVLDKNKHFWRKIIFNFPLSYNVHYKFCPCDKVHYKIHDITFPINRS